MESLLKIEDLNISFQTGEEQIHPVREIQMEVQEEETLAIIGESGCGKSVLGNSILRLLPENAIVTGKIYLDGEDILSYSKQDFRRIRGKKLSAIPQSPVSSLDPSMKTGKQVMEALYVHEKPDKKTAADIVRRLFRRLHLGENGEYCSRYSCELSGGMCQRVLIAMGVITHPKLLIVDEPTKGLDWTLRRNVVDIFKELKENMDCAMLLITHDIAVADRLADRIAVMYCGEIVETGRTEDVLGNPEHPYTQGLLGALPSRGFHTMKGFSPALTELPRGCKFHPRCPWAEERCRMERPQMRKGREDHKVRCFLWKTEVKER